MVKRVNEFIAKCDNIRKKFGVVDDPKFKEEFVSLLMHYQGGTKYNDGNITDLVVDMDAWNKYPTIYVIYPDKPRDNPSVKKMAKECLSRMSVSVLEKFKHASRCEIDPQILEYRANNPPLLDDDTDHYPTSFQEILHSFCVEENLTTFPEVGSSQGGRHFFADTEFADRWREYHREHATYRNINKSINRSLGQEVRKLHLKFPMVSNV